MEFGMLLERSLPFIMRKVHAWFRFTCSEVRRLAGMPCACLSAYGAGAGGSFGMPAALNSDCRASTHSRASNAKAPPWHRAELAGA